MTAATELVVTEPGTYTMSDRVYHADPVPAGSLSSTGARTLLAKSPAEYRYEADHGRPEKRAFDLGHAWHTMVLGTGSEIVTVPYDTYNTNAAKAIRDEAYDAHMVPLLTKELAQVEAMTDALWHDPLARSLLDNGIAEESMFWVDGDHGVWRRARTDWIRHGKRSVLVDLKSTTALDTDSLRRTVLNYGYHQQADWYLDAAANCLTLTDASFVFLFQSKNPPYLVRPVQLKDEWLDLGHQLNQKALRLFARCQETGLWPGYSHEIDQLDILPYADRRSGYEEDTDDD